MSKDPAPGDDHSSSPCAAPYPSQAPPRQFGMLRSVLVAESFDDPLLPSEVALWGDA